MCIVFPPQLQPQPVPVPYLVPTPVVDHTLASELRALIKEFRDVVAAARVADATLEARVTELERQLTLIHDAR